MTDSCDTCGEERERQRCGLALDSSS